VAVDERYSVAVGDLEASLAIATSLAASAHALLRWAAIWPDGPRNDLPATLAGRLTALPKPLAEQPAPLCLESPTMDEVRVLLAHAPQEPTCVHWSPAHYAGEEGGGAPWLAFVDAQGRRSEDARVLRIELGRNAVPLTVSDRSWQPDFVFGPQRSEGLDLRVAVVRDHMPREQLCEHLAAGASLPLSAITPAVTNRRLR
jgi:hypothetical protein